MASCDGGSRGRRVTAAVLLGLTLGCGPTPAHAMTSDGQGAGTAPGTPSDHVVVLTLDGLNPRALTRLGADATPHLHRFLRRGASTLEARTTTESTATLPNHTGMVTGRRVDAAREGHGVTWNDDRLRPATVHQAAGERVRSLFGQVRLAGGSSVLYAGKSKFRLWTRSWRHAIESTTVRRDNDTLVDDFIADLAQPQTLRFLHLSAPDVAGHEHGFMTRPYLRAVRRTDARVGRIMRALTRSALWASTTVIMTSDHGGSRAGHYDPTVRANYRILFAARGHGVEPGADLYDLNPQRAHGRSQVPYTARRQPLRNGDVANLVLDLLGLGAVPGSQINHDQDLTLTAS